ncbi:MAG: multicopper oxidase domain-containing protein, partial [Moraxellaceae bacterium]
MTDADFSGGRGPSCTRRRFVEGAALTGLALGLGWPARGHAVNTAAAADAPSKKVVELAIGEQAVNVTGRRRTAITVNRSLPAPVLRFREGDDLELRVTNHLREDTSIHWHGILLPANMDGVPGLSFHGIPPGET